MANTIKSTGVIERSWYRSGRYEIDVWVMRPRQPGRYPVVIYNHGSRKAANGLIDAKRPTLSADTAIWHGVSTGQCAVVFPEGRGYGNSTGPTLGDCLTISDVWTYLQGRAQDVVAAAAWLQRQDWADTSNILLWGCSHGGIVSLLAQAEMPVAGTVLQAPAIGDQSREVSNPIPLQAMEKAAAPVLIQHAQHDLAAPIEYSRSLHQLGRELGKDIRFQSFPFIQTMVSHDQFNWQNREIWGPDLDGFVCETLGINGHLVRVPGD